MLTMTLRRETFCPWFSADFVVTVILTLFHSERNIAESIFSQDKAEE